MKLFIALLATIISFSAHAADQKLGNVILVEREIPNPYDLCLKNVIEKPDKKQTSFNCVIKYTKASMEIPVGKTSPIMYTKDNCKVRSEIGNGSMIISFGTDKDAVDFETARACLSEGLTSQGRLTVKVMTIE